MKNPFRYFDSSPEVIRLVVMMYVKYPLSLRNVEDLLAERGIDICHETVRLWWNRFGPMFAAEGTVKANYFSRLMANFIMILMGRWERIRRFLDLFECQKLPMLTLLTFGLTVPRRGILGRWSPPIGTMAFSGGWPLRSISPWSTLCSRWPSARCSMPLTTP